MKLVAAAAAVLSCSGCGLLDKGDDSGAAADQTVPTQPPPSTVDPVAEGNALIADCVQWVQTAAFSGQPQMQALWAQVGQDPAALTTQCTTMLDGQRLLLQQMSTQLAVVTGTAATPTTEAAAEAAPDAGAVPAPTAAPTTAAVDPAGAASDPAQVVEPGAPARQTEVLPANH